MRNAHVRYMCFPSVVLTGKETEVKIAPRDTSRIFREDQQYEVCIFGLTDDMSTYHSQPDYDVPCEIKNGCLCFKYTFDKEQEYSVRFRLAGEKETRISLYALDEDLYSRRPLKGDLHTHTYYSDGQDGIMMTPADYREEGFDFFSLTDHNRRYTSVLAAELYENVDLGMLIMPGEEVHTPDSLLHIVHAGGKESVALKYIKDRETYESEVAEIERTLTHIPETYRKRMAMAKWASDNIHNAGGIAIFPHPYWCPLKYNISHEFSSLLFSEKIFDAFELMGGITNAQDNVQLALWQEQCAKGNPIPVVGSSDSHNHDSEVNDFARRFTIVFAKDNTTEAILDAIKNGYSVAGELATGSTSDVRFYAPQMRLVMFSHFLFQNYFNETWRLCVGEGILMRRYAEGEDVGEILSALAPTVENFYKRFYGLTPYEGLCEHTRAFLDKCLDLQLKEGPLTKGSSLKSAKITRRI